MATLTLTPKGFRASLPSGLPDLIVQSVSVTPSSPNVGDHVVFSAVVKNQGTGPTPSDIGIGVLFSIDSAPVNWTTDTQGALAPGATRTLTATSGTSGSNYWAATLGSHALLVNVNDTLAISETVTVNNTLNSNVSVAGITPPSSSTTFGPLGNQGTRWPANTPTFNQAVPNSVEVDPTWAAIKAGIQSFTAAQVAAGARVMVRPGAVSGNGGGSTATPAIQDAGSTSWTKRVLVRPRDGYGSVTIGSTRVFRVHGVTFAGFITSSFRIDSCINAGQAWFKINGQADWATTAGEPDMTGLHVVEVVVPANFVAASDVSDCWPKGGDIVSPVFDGMYMGPAFRPAGSTFHVDTLQFEGFNGAVVTGATLRDCAFYGSKNCAVEISCLREPLIDHCYIVAQPYQTGRYPYPSGSDTQTNAWALNGGSGSVDMTIQNSVTIGQWEVRGTHPVSVVTDVISRFDYSSTYPGSYTVYGNLTDDNFESLTGLSRPGIPDTDYRLADIWA